MKKSTYPKKMKTLVQKDMCPHVHWSNIYNIQIMRTIQMSIGWTDKENVIYTHTGILYSAIRKWNDICDNMERCFYFFHLFLLVGG